MTWEFRLRGIDQKHLYIRYVDRSKEHRGTSTSQMYFLSRPSFRDNSQKYNLTPHIGVILDIPLTHIAD